MPNPAISAHMVIKNEQNWVWHAIMSVIDYVDEFLVVDTGSTDHTPEIVRSIFHPKLKFREAGAVDRPGVTKIRQELLQQTRADWIFTIDGDEIWPDYSIKETVKFIRQSVAPIEYLIHPSFNCLGDIYHYQDYSAGRYQIGPYRGTITIRFMNRNLLPGVRFSGEHGHEGALDNSGALIQDRLPFAGQFLELPYIHTTHLQRTSKINSSQVFMRSHKYKYELGNAFPHNFAYPKVFYMPAPQYVPSPWQKRSAFYVVNSLWQTPLKIAKRALLKA